MWNSNKCTLYSETAFVKCLRLVSNMSKSCILFHQCESACFYQLENNFYFITLGCCGKLNSANPGLFTEIQFCWCIGYAAIQKNIK